MQHDVITQLNFGMTGVTPILRTGHQFLVHGVGCAKAMPFLGEEEEFWVLLSSCLSGKECYASLGSREL
jgi:hypothetical protein